MNKKEDAAAKTRDMLEKMTVEELFKLLSKTEREYVRSCIERTLSESVCKTENDK